jgi:sec-independent protein translocase protein TatC
MCALALPIVVLYFVAAGISLANDRRKRRADPFRNLDDDEAAELDDDYVYNDDDNDDAPSGSVTAADVDEPEDLDEPLPAQRSKASAKSLRSRYADDDIT